MSKSGWEGLEPAAQLPRRFCSYLNYLHSICYGDIALVLLPVFGNVNAPQFFMTKWFPQGFHRNEPLQNTRKPLWKDAVSRLAWPVFTSRDRSYFGANSRLPLKWSVVLATVALEGKRGTSKTIGRRQRRSPQCETAIELAKRWDKRPAPATQAA